ncbi:MAG: peptidylprolyl isomerase [Chloroflexi bacterium]|nr:peptidylprolyl isomerase [Chloroflexota bacterium]
MSEVVKQGDNVKVHYTGKLLDGSVFDSSEGRDPLEFTVGTGQMIAGFDKGVVGMVLDEQKEITIPPEEAYGIYDPEKIIEVPNDQFPEDLSLEVGMQISASQPDGSPIPFTVKEIGEQNVTLDGNHFLAGKDLIFSVTLVSIT